MQRIYFDPTRINEPKKVPLPRLPREDGSAPRGETPTVTMLFSLFDVPEYAYLTETLQGPMLSFEYLFEDENTADFTGSSGGRLKVGKASGRIHDIGFDPTRGNGILIDGKALISEWRAAHPKARSRSDEVLHSCLALYADAILALCLGREGAMQVGS